METRKKGVLIGTFVKKKDIYNFVDRLCGMFNMSEDKIFIYKVDGNKDEYLTTFKSYDKSILSTKLKESTVLHVKNGCLFSINALNKLIESECGSVNTSYIIDWDKYKDSLIINNKGEFTIHKICKIVLD